MKRNNNLSKIYILIIMCIGIVAIVATLIYFIKK